MGSRNKFSPGEIVRFEYEGEMKQAVISALGTLEDSDWRTDYARIHYGGNEYTVDLELLHKIPMKCTDHGKRFYSQSRDEYICPFCNND